MPGENCSIVGCGSSRRTQGIGIFKVPSEKVFKEWRKNFLEVICKSRVVDKQFQEQIRKDRVFVCEKHFALDEIDIFKSEKLTKKKLKVGSIPTLNLPKQREEKTNRRILQRKNLNPLEEKDWKSLDELLLNSNKFKLPDGWVYEITEKELFVKNFDESTKIPRYLIHINTGFNFTIIYYGWKIPEDNILYKTWKRSMKNITVYDLIIQIESSEVCCGVDCREFNGKLLSHAIPQDNESDSDEESPMQPFSAQIIFRTKSCEILHSKKELCNSCSKFNKEMKKSSKINECRLMEPAKLKAPISKTTPHRVKLRLQQERLKCAQLEKKIAEMRTELGRSSIHIDNNLSNDFISIFSGSDNTTPFMNLFWQEQKKMFQSKPTGIRYHPMIIRFCLSIASKSMSAYEELRNSNILKLPSSRTLRDYKNYIRPKVGFQRKIILDLIEITDSFFNVERYISLSIDEMKISSNLVFDKTTNELIGYVDLGDPDINFNTIVKEDNLATHAMVFFVRGIATSLKYSFVYFATEGVTAIQMFPLLWEAISLLEVECNLWVVAVISDGAAANRRLYSLHKHMNDYEFEGKFVYKTINIFAIWRFIYFICDAPHLIKTARNCLFHSGYGNSSRCMWKNGNHLLWQHVVQIWKEDLYNPLKLLPKITYNHIYLTPFSKMTVSYAAQVLSQTMAKVLETFGTPDTTETSKYCHMMDAFFDCLNVRHPKEGERKRKEFLKPYTSIGDSRFKWLLETFLTYFDNWLEEVTNRPGGFSKIDTMKMFISWQTYQGLHITCHSIIELVQFLLEEGMEYVLTERFCQDPLENYFGNQRGQGRRSDNPDIQKFGYNDNTIRIQRHVSHSSGNTKGRYDKKRPWEEVTEQPIKRKSRK